MRARNYLFGGAGMMRRVMRPFIVLALLFGLMTGLELSAVLATEFLAAEEEELGRLLNEERVERGLPELRVADALRTIARRHSQRMMMEGTIFHSQTFREEVEAVFPDWASIGENVGVSPDVPSVHQAYMDSPGHRANILNEKWRWMGIGMVAGDGRMFSTQNFLQLQAGAPEPQEAQPETPLPGTRLAGENRYETGFAIADWAFDDGEAGGAVVADGTDFHGALAGAALAGEFGGPVLLANPDGNTPGLDGTLDRLLTDDGEVVAVGINGVRGRSMQLDGSFEQVAADVARALSTTPTEVFVTTVANYPDALAASAVSAVAGIPVLYTDTDELSGPTREVIEELAPDTVHVLGGPVAVSDDVADELRDLGPRVRRIAGNDRYATAVAVAEFGLDRGLDLDEVIIATGRNFPDALAAGAAAAPRRAPIVLTEQNSVPQPTADFLARNGDRIQEIVVTGGPVAISEATQRALDSARR